MNSSFFLRKPLGKYNPFWRVFLDIIEFVKYDILLAHWNSFSLLSNHFVQKERTLLITPWTKVCHPGSELQRPRCLLHYLHTEICPASFQSQTWLKTPFPPWSLLQWKRMSSCGASLYLVAHTNPCSFTEMTVTKIREPAAAFLYISMNGQSSPKWKASCLHYLFKMFGYSWFSFHM